MKVVAVARSMPGPVATTAPVGVTAADCACWHVDAWDRRRSATRVISRDIPLLCTRAAARVV